MAAPIQVAYSKSDPNTTYANAAAVAVPASFTWGAGDVIVVTCTLDTGVASFVTIDNETNLAFIATGAGAGTGTTCWGRSWYAIATGSGSGTISGVITVPSGAPNPVSLQAWHYTNSLGVGNFVGAALTGTTPTQALTVSRASSTVITAWGDYSALGGGATGVTASGTLTEREDTSVTGAFDTWGGEWSGVSLGAQNWGTTSGTGRNLTFAGTIEVLGDGNGNGVDSFNRANGGLGSSWATITSMAAPAIVSNAVVASTTAADYGARWTERTFPNDQWAEADATITAVSYSDAAVAVRVQSGARTYYDALWSSDSGGTYWIEKVTAGTTVSLASVTGVGTTNTRKLRLEVVGSVLRMRVNGAQVLTATDTSITSGSPGVTLYAETGDTSTLNNFASGPQSPWGRIGEGHLDYPKSSYRYPTGLSGGADAWDDGPASAILLEDYFPAAVGVALTETVTDAIGILDPNTVDLTTGGGSSLTHTQTDPVGLVDSTSVAKAINVTVTDLVGVLDPNTPSKANIVTQTDLIGLLDPNTLVDAMAIVVTDLVGVVDSNTPSKANIVNQTDLVGLLDPNTLASVAQLSFNDVIGLLDPNTPSMGGQVAVVDPLGITDAGVTVDLLRSLDETFTEPIGLLDSVSISMTTALVVTDPVGVLDPNTRASVAQLGFTDAIGILDPNTPSRGVNVAQTDLVGILDPNTRSSVAQLSFVDPIGLLDSNAPSKSNIVNQTDLLGIVDSSTTSQVAQIVITDLVGILDPNTRSSVAQLSFVDPIGILDPNTVIESAGLDETRTEPIGILDSVSFSMSSVIVDPIGLLDSASPSRGLHLVSSGFVYSYNFDTPDSEDSSWTFGGGDLTLINNGTAHSGPNFVRVKRRAADSLYPGIALINFPFKVGASYQFSVWARVPVTSTQATQNLYLRQDLRHANDNIYWDPRGVDVPNDGVWHNYTFTFNMNPIGGSFGPSSAYQWWIQHNGTLDDANAVLEWDDITVTVLAEPGVRENVGITDPVGQASSMTRTDPIGLLDPATPSKANIVNPTDLVGITDPAPPVVKAGNVSIVETVGINDIQVRYASTVEIIEIVGLSDNQNIAALQQLAINELLGVTDSSTTLKTINVVSTDLIGMVDGAEVVRGVNLIFNDPLGILDSYVADGGGIIQILMGSPYVVDVILPENVTLGVDPLPNGGTEFDLGLQDTLIEVVYPYQFNAMETS